MLFPDYFDQLVLIAVCLASAGLGVFVLRRPNPVRSMQTGSEDGCGAATERPDEDERVFPCNLAPFPIWSADSDGTPVWTNDAYRKLLPENGQSGPEPVLFPISSRSQSGRISFSAELHRPGVDGPARFSVTAVKSRRGWHGFAIPEVQEKGASQREFTQTLAKTFAQLSTGLAIFDADRRLQLFNPALVDLCGLPVDFLSMRPDLATFFDGLRERQMIPEPRDYASWRDRIADLAVAAASGRYQETWTLPSGSVYEVIGRPHPGGATAFLIQDISAEVTLTRQFRHDLDLYHSIFDALEDAFCVISEQGDLAYANASYEQFWGLEPNTRYLSETVQSALDIWASACRDSDLWDELRTKLDSGSLASKDELLFTLSDGRRARVSLRPLSGGAILIRFRAETEEGQDHAQTVLASA